MVEHPTRNLAVASSLFDLSGRVAIVSGAASGLGQAMSLAFAESGADLVLADLNGPGMEITAQQIAALGRKVVQVVCDVSQPARIRELFARCDQEFGRLDILGNVAGEGILGPPEEISIENVQTVLQNLVIGRFAACQEAGKRMLKQRKGCIINIGSLASITALGRGHIAYSMAMGAVAQMTKELSTEWSSSGVRVNAILPAQVVNPGLTKRMQADPGLEGRFKSGIPTGRLGRPDDIKGLAVFLASDSASWITGALIPMDGGNLAMNAGGTPRR